MFGLVLKAADGLEHVAAVPGVKAEPVLVGQVEVRAAVPLFRRHCPLAVDLVERVGLAGGHLYTVRVGRVPDIHAAQHAGGANHGHLHGPGSRALTPRSGAPLDPVTVRDGPARRACLPSLAGAPPLSGCFQQHPILRARRQGDATSAGAEGESAIIRICSHEAIRILKRCEQASRCARAVRVDRQPGVRGESPDQLHRS